MSYSEKIEAEYDRLKAMSLAKNKSYGDSMFVPLGVLNKQGPEVSIRSRIDDKLARLQSEDISFESEADTIDDVIGYLVGLRIVMREA